MRFQPNRQFVTVSKAYELVMAFLPCIWKCMFNFSELSICHRCMKNPNRILLLIVCHYILLEPTPSSYQIFFFLLIFFGHHLNKSVPIRACFYIPHSLSIHQIEAFFPISYFSWCSVSMRKSESALLMAFECQGVIFIANILMSTRTKIPLYIFYSWTCMNTKNHFYKWNEWKRCLWMYFFPLLKSREKDVEHSSARQL